MNTYNLTTYPIACMAMNRVSDLKLALAVRQGGGLPSLSIFNYYSFKTGSRKIDCESLLADLIEYKKQVGDLNILLSFGVAEFLSPEVFSIVETHLPCAVELIIEPQDSEKLNELFEKTNALRQRGCLLFKKSLGAGDTEHIIEQFDGIVLKGNEGAGTVVKEQTATLESNFKRVQDKFPGKLIIPNGGIGTAEQVKYYLDAGAYAVGIGTLFAAAEESAVSATTKQKMIEASAADLEKTTSGAHQQGLFFSKPFEKDSFNNTQSLISGVKTGTSGHILAGKGIDHISAILPAAEIIKRLIIV